MPETPLVLPSSTGNQVPAAPATGAGHWEGDYWVESDGRKIARKWVDNFPEFYGPEAVDPDHGTGEAEADDIVSRWSARIMGVTYQPGYNGQFSNYNERHSFIGGINIGVTLSEIEAVPTPSFWVDDAHYFKSGIAVGYAIRWAKKYAVAGFAAGGAAGTLFGPELIQLAGKLLSALGIGA